MSLVIQKDLLFQNLHYYKYTAKTQWLIISFSPFEAGVITSCTVSFTPSPVLGNETLVQVLVLVLDLLPEI